MIPTVVSTVISPLNASAPSIILSFGLFKRLEAMPKGFAVSLFRNY